MTGHLRLAQPADYRATEELTREAFWGLNHPGCDEHLLLHKLRAVPASVPELDYVAEVNGKLVGHVIYSKRCPSILAPLTASPGAFRWGEESQSRTRPWPPLP